MSDILISIVIPVYNVEKYLRQCIDSVINQSYKNIEIILINDGSTDGSGTICNSYLNKDKRVKVIHKQNGGASDSRNKGIDIAKGEYIIFLDSDDYWTDTNSLYKIVNKLSKKKVDVLSFGYVKFNEESNKSIIFKIEENNKLKSDKYSQLKYMISNNYYIACPCNKVIRLNLIKKEQLYFKLGITSEDIDWCTRLMIKAKSFDTINDNFYVYRQRSNSVTHTIQLKNIQDLRDNIVNSLDYINHEIDKKLRKLYMSYIAYQYSTFFITASRCNDIKVENIIKDMERYSYVLNYGQSTKLRVIKYMKKLLGRKISTKIMIKYANRGE